MDFLAKLNTIKVDERAFFAKEDLDFVDSTYEVAQLCIQKTEAFFKELKPLLSKIDSYLPWDFTKHEKDLSPIICQRWVDDVLYHFQNKYKISIKEFKVKKRSDVTKQEILTFIQSQMDGMDFQEKKFQETISEARKLFTNRFDSPQLKNKQVKLIDVLYWKDRWLHSSEYYFGYGSARDRAKVFANTLQLFEFGEFNEVYEPFEKFADIETLLPFTWELNLEKIKKIRFFKNDNVTITFDSHETAKKFYNKFCI